MGVVLFCYFLLWYVCPAVDASVERGLLYLLGRCYEHHILWR